MRVCTSPFASALDVARGKPYPDLFLHAAARMGADPATASSIFLTTITDVMMICTGTSNRHVVSLARHVYDTVREAGHPVLGIEGLDEGEWALVDLGDVVVHVMQTQTRAFYQLEKLWDMKEAKAARA